MTSMEEAYKRDMQAQRHIRDLRLAIESFLLVPSRVDRFTYEALAHGARQLREEEQRSVRRWD